MPKRKLSKRIRRVPKKSSFNIFILVAGIALVALIGLANLNSSKQTSISSTPQNVLGENREANNLLAVCSSGGLSTSTNKVFQMTYPNETFQQLTNTDALKDVSQLKDLTCLQYLDATDRTVKGDIANLKNLTNLEVFSLYSNPEVYGDICSLSNATKLRSLKLAFNPKITGDISCLKKLIKLETFAMTDTQIYGDLSAFSNMPNLKALYINGTKVKGNICSLSKLVDMEELGIADEAGNPDIIGDLSCLDNLQNLKRVSLYNTGTTNCEQFTKDHPNLANTKTESGKQGGGGCSKESRSTLINQNQKYEKKIGKEQIEEANYQKDGFDNYNQTKPNIGRDINNYQEPENKSFFAKIVNLFRNLFSLFSSKRDRDISSQIRSKAGPGGCNSEAECNAYCSKPENNNECSKFAPPNSSQSSKGESNTIPNLKQGGPGGCKSQTECQAFCSKAENKEECSQFGPPDEGR